MTLRRVAACAALAAASAGPTSAAPPDAHVAGLVASAERLRGLALSRPLDVRTLDRGRLRAELTRLLAAEPDPHLGADWDDAYHLLGVLGPRQHVREVLLAGLTDQVAGLYDDRGKRLLLISSGRAEATEATIVHEVVHAIQDQRFDLSSRRFRPGSGQGDAARAAQSLIEGDALEVQTRFVAGAGLSGALGELFGALAQAGGGSGATLPPYFQREFVQPYLLGERFVSDLRRRGGQRLLDRAFRRPPRTTAAIMDPARYLGGDPGPVAVAIAAPPPGWRRRIATTYGAADVAVLTGDEVAARSWTGGRLALDGRGRRRRLTIELASSRAVVLVPALRRALPRRAVVARHGSRVHVVLAGSSA